MKKKILMLCMLSVLMLTGCEKEKIEMPKENPIVTMTIEDYGDIKMELYPKTAYNTVANFVNLVEDGFYDNNAITRVQRGFVVQAGGTKELDYTIKGEFNENGFENNLSHDEGVISMARTMDPDSASGQFFIVLSDEAKSSLDNKYAAFGKVIEGMDIIHEIEDNNNLEFADEQFFFLKDNITIKKAVVDTKGYTYKVSKN